MPFRIPVLYGAASFGSPETAARTTELAVGQQFIDLMVAHGQNGLDTARIYSSGTSESFISKLDLKGLRVDTKAYAATPGAFAPAGLKKLLKQSVEALGPNIKIRVYYLHMPDRSVPYEETCAAINDLHRAGHFEEFGLSNFAAWEVAQIYTICKERGWVLPTAYQGCYNCLDRAPEDELFPCLRKFGIKYAAYSPLAGGFLTGKLLDAEPEPGTRFHTTHPVSRIYNERYNHATEAVRRLRAETTEAGLTLAEVAVRWLQHHSAMTPEDLGIIHGGSLPEQLEAALIDNAKGPLPQKVLDAVERTWKDVKANAPRYWF